jgi:hypothetical protein
MEKIKKWFVICGILSTVIYIATDIVATLGYQNYSYVSQCFSELQAVDAPTRPFVVIFMSIYNLSILLFSIGLMLTDKRKRALVAGLMLIGYAFSGEITTLFYPMHMRGVEGNLSDTMHANLTFVFVFFTLLFMGFAATLYEKKFLLYTVFTVLLLILFGSLAGMDGSLMAENLPTPWLGIKERINIYASLLWILIFASKIFLLYRKPKQKECQ